MLALGRSDHSFSNLRHFSQSTRRARRSNPETKNTLDNNVEQQLQACQNARELSMLVRSNGRLFYHRLGFELLQQHILAVLKETTRMTPAQVAGLMNAVSGLDTVAKSQQRQVLLDLSQVALPLLEECQVKEISIILNSLARKNVRNDKVFHRSSHLLESMYMNPQDLAVVSNAYARIHHKSPMLFDTIALQAISQIQNFTPQGLANLVNAFAKQDHPDSKLFNAVAIQVEGCLLNDGDSFTPQGLANIVNAFAKMNHPSSKIFEAIAEVSIPNVHDFNAQNLSNMANAYAKMNHEHPELFSAILDAALDKMSSFKAQELANLANAFGKNMDNDDTTNHDQTTTTRLLQEIARAAIPILPTFKAQELAMLLNALTKQPIELLGEAQNFWEASAKATIALPPRFFEPKELCIIANAFSKAPNDDETLKKELFDKIADAAYEWLVFSPEHPDRPEFQPQNLSNLANAFAKLNVYYVDLFDRLMTRAMLLHSEMNPQELANFMSAIAKVRVKGPIASDLFAQMVEVLKSDDYNLASWEQRNLVEIAYAFLKANKMDKDVLERIGSELCSRPTLELDAVGLGHLAATLSQTQISCSKELLSAIFSSFESIPQERIQISNLADISKALPLAYELKVVVSASNDTGGFFDLVVKYAIRKRNEANPSDVRDLLLNLTSPRLDSSTSGDRNVIMLNLQQCLLAAYQPVLDELSDQIATKHMRTIRRAYKRLSVLT